MYYMVLQNVVKEKATKEVMMQHVDYMHTLFEDENIVISGPFSDDRAGGMFIIEGENEKVIEDLVAKDPAVKAGTLINEIRKYDLKFLRN